jgi:hypothetical protein
LRSIDITGSLLGVAGSCAESAEKLKAMGTGLDAAVSAVAEPKNKRHGPLHVAAGTRYLEMCKMLVRKYKCNTNAAGADGMLRFVSSPISA